MNENIFDRAPRGTKADDDRLTGLEMHTENMYDEDGDRAGEIADLRTGKRIDNSTDLGLGDLSESDVDELLTNSARDDESAMNEQLTLLANVKDPIKRKELEEWLKANAESITK